MYRSKVVFIRSSSKSSEIKLRCVFKMVPVIHTFNVYQPCLWVPVTTAWRVLRLRMEERPLICRVAASILNKQSLTADKVLSSSLRDGRGANNSSPWKTKCYEILIGQMLPLETKQSGGKILPHSDLRGGGSVSRGGIMQQEKWRALVSTVMNLRVP